MKQRRQVVFALVMLMAVNFRNVSAFSVSLSFAGMGFQSALVIPDDVDMRDVDHEAPPFLYDDIDVGVHFAAQGDVGIRLDKVGEVHYWPSVGLWFGFGDHTYAGDDYDLFGMELLLNLFDAYYQFPVPVMVKPYVGFGPMITIMIGRWENDDTREDGHGIDPDIGMNLFTGVHFDVSPQLRFFAEIRGRLSRWDLLRLTAGMTFGQGRR